MKFDITKIDKVKLLQTLYKHSFTSKHGIGQAVYMVKEMNGENVEYLTDEECENILLEFNDGCSEEPMYKGCRILDYHNGKPMKIIFERKNNGRILVESNGYDSRNGRYKFLKAMIDAFPIDSILIVHKNYPSHKLIEMDKYGNTTKEEVVYYKNLINSCIKKENELGAYWQIIDKLG